MRLRPLFCSLVFLSVLAGSGDRLFLASQQAHAQSRLVVNRPYSGGRRAIELSLRLPSAYFGYEWVGKYYEPGFYSGYGLGPGLQLMFPLVPNVGRLINNTFYLGFFADAILHPYDCGFGCGAFAVSVAFGPQAQWRLFLMDLLRSGSFDLFINFGFGLWPWFTRHEYYGFGFFPLLQLGTQIMFTRAFGIGLQFGYPSAQFTLNFGF